MTGQPATVWQPWARFVGRVRWDVVQGAFALGAFAAALRLHDPLMGWAFAAYVLMLTGVFVTGGYERPSRLVAMPILFVLGSLGIGVILSNDRGSALTLFTWSAAAVPCIAVRPRILHQVAPFGIALLAAHSSILLIDGLAGTYRPTGLVFNPNPAAALLVLGAVGVLAARKPWLLMAFTLPLTFTGSRWATFVLMVMVAWFWVRNPDMRWAILAAVAVTGYFVLWQWNTVSVAYRIGYSVEAALEKRATLEGYSVGFLPSGVAHIEGMHNLYLRVAYEAGILAGLAFAALSVAGLVRGRGAVRWLLGTMMLLGLMDYYTWQIGGMAVVWWATLGLCFRSERCAQPSSHC